VAARWAPTEARLPCPMGVRVPWVSVSHGCPHPTDARVPRVPASHTCPAGCLFPVHSFLPCGFRTMVLDAGAQQQSSLRLLAARQLGVTGLAFTLLLVPSGQAHPTAEPRRGKHLGWWQRGGHRGDALAPVRALRRDALSRSLPVPTLGQEPTSPAAACGPGFPQ